MIFGKKLAASMEWLRKRSKGTPEPPDGEEDLPTMEELKKEAERAPLEKGDLPAMILAGFVTIVPACLLALLVLCLVAWLFIR